MADEMNENQDQQRSQNQDIENLPTDQPDLVGTPDSVADDLDNDTDGNGQQDVNEAGAKGGAKTGVADNTGDYAGRVVDDSVNADEAANNPEDQQLADNAGYDEWGYYSTEDDLDY